MQLVMAYIACKNQSEAQTMARTLVQEKLVACANVIPAVQSFFVWKGKTENQTEAILICKTLEEKMAAVQKRVKELHSYDVPCIAFYQAKRVNKEYLNWVNEVTT